MGLCYPYWTPQWPSGAVIQQAAQLMGRQECLRPDAGSEWWWKGLRKAENHLLPWLRRPAPKVIQSGPIRVLRQQMFKDQIRAGVQFKKIDGQHNQEKISVKQAQALSIYSPTFSAKLDVNVTQEGSGWGLWQSQSSLWTPMRFWSQVWHGAE